jgi:hypothetical protein
MNPNQAAGYIFEKTVMNLLEDSGYVGVKKKVLKGRGAYHQIDAYGILSFPTPFTYPIRLIAEAKCYKTAIELHHIRDFLGVIKDISENYIVGDNRHRNTPDRYLDTGCYFSASPFSRPAQDYAWAQNIFLVSFFGIEKMNAIVELIRQFTSGNENQIRSLSQKVILGKYHQWVIQKGYLDKYPSILLGIIDNTYPVVLVGNKNWHERINVTKESDFIGTTDNKRISKRNETVFNLNITTSVGNVEPVSFNLSDQIAEKIISRMEREKSNKAIFVLDIPLESSKKNPNSIRRLLRINVILDDNEKIKYLLRLKKRKGRIAQLHDKHPRSRSSTISPPSSMH